MEIINCNKSNLDKVIGILRVPNYNNIMSDKIRRHLIKRFWEKFGIKPKEYKPYDPISAYEKMNNELFLLRSEKKTKEVKQRIKKLNYAIKKADRAVGIYTTLNGNYKSSTQPTL